MEDLILLAIGNASRGDDGLGWAFARAVEDDDRFEGRVEYRYQLQVEDAGLVAGCSRVIFVDAWQNAGDEPFRWSEVGTSADLTYTTHRLTPQAVMHLCKELFDRMPEAHLLAIAGEDWALGSPLSPRADANLEQALNWFFERRL